MADYLEVISGPPMDLATVMRKFRGGAYPSAQVMREDVVRVWRNAYDFNGPENPVYERALELSDRFDERFEALVAPPFHHLAGCGSTGKASMPFSRAPCTRPIASRFLRDACALSACLLQRRWPPWTLPWPSRVPPVAQGCYVVYDDGDEEWCVVCACAGRGRASG